jgi:peptide/nickel transport system substrate-binding protein
MTSITRRALALVALGLALLPASCGKGDPAGKGGGASGTGGATTFVYARGKDSPTHDPAEATYGESAIVLVNVYDTLVRFKYGSSAIEPALAVAWEAAADRRAMTFTLRDGVRFHDGSACDAAAVVANFERQRDLSHPFHFTAPGQPPARYPYWGDMFGFVAKTTAVDVRTVRFEFNEPMPPFFLSLLAMVTNSIVSPKALEQGAGYVKRHPVGTGAFVWGCRENEEITLTANPSWWGGKPAIDRLCSRWSPSSRTRTRLESGQVDGVDNLASKDVPRAKANAKVKVHEVATGLSVCYLAMNNDRKPFDDVRVRQAVALAVDKPRLAAIAYDGLATPIATLVPPGVEGHAGLPDRARDVKEARRLLEEAKAVGTKVTLRYMGNPRPYAPDPGAIAAQLRDDLRDAGLEVELRKDEWASHLQAMQNGDHELGILGWTPDVPDPDNYLYVLPTRARCHRPTTFDFTGRRVPRAGGGRAAVVRRGCLYADAQKVAFDDAPMVPLVAMPRVAAVGRRGGLRARRCEPAVAWTSKPARL